MIRRVVIGAALALIACACAAQRTEARQEIVLGVKVNTADSDGFYRQADGSWIETAPNGVARFRFTQEREAEGVAIVFDETRHVRLRIDPAAGTITEEASGAWRPLYRFSEIVRGAPLSPAPADAPVTRVWFEHGGGFARFGDAWVEISPVDGKFGEARWREESRDAGAITLRETARQTLARIALGEGAVYLSDGDAALQRKAIRAIDRGA